MIVKEVYVKSILSKSRVFDYSINPYIGCEHECAYCYARFMKRFSGHRERWGEFVDVKINAAELLRHEIERKPVGRVWVSGVCDPYQPIEDKYNLARSCLKILFERKWPVTVQTKSGLVLRDLDLIKPATGVEVGFTITTADENIKSLFEAKSPSIEKRVEALGVIHSAGVKTFAMIAPVLPGVEGLPELLKGHVDYVLIDRLNYNYANRVYREHGLEDAMTDDFFTQKKKELTSVFKREGLNYQFIY